MDNLVIFAGAGFGKFAGLPVMTNFSDRLRASGYLKDRQAEFDHIQLECDALGAFIGGSARNLEQLASFLSVMKLTNPEYRFPGCIKYAAPSDALDLVMECTRRLTCCDLDGNLVSQRT